MTSGYLSAHTEPWAGSEREQGVVPGQPGPHKPLILHPARWAPPDPQLRAGPSASAAKGPEPSTVSSPVLPSTLRLSSPICKMGRGAAGTGWSEGVSETEGSGFWHL